MKELLSIMSEKVLLSEDTDAANNSEIVINKRRSVVFQRRSINPQRGYETNNEVQKEDTFDLENYILSLKNEKEAWKKVLNERKFQRRQLEKKAESKACEGIMELDLSILTEADRAFVISERSDYDESGKMEDLLKVATKVAALNMEMHHLHETMSEKFNQRIEWIGKKIDKFP